MDILLIERYTAYIAGGEYFYVRTQFSGNSFAKENSATQIYTDNLPGLWLYNLLPFRSCSTSNTAPFYVDSTMSLTVIAMVQWIMGLYNDMLNQNRNQCDKLHIFNCPLVITRCPLKWNSP